MGLTHSRDRELRRKLAGPYLAGEGQAAPPVIVEKRALFASRCPFSLERNVPFHHPQ